MATKDISIENILLVLNELTEKSEKQSQESEKQRQERENEWKEIREMFKETDKKFQETDKKFQETDRQFKETDKKINKAHGLFTSKWGELVESIVRPACLKLFRERGVDVCDTSRNRKIDRNGIRKAEYDVVLANGTEVVIVEVKTTLTTSAVDNFVKKLKEVKTWLPQYEDKKVYGAVAGISLDNDAIELAEKKGLFIIENSGEGLMSISNPKDFKPKEY